MEFSESLITTGSTSFGESPLIIVLLTLSSGCTCCSTWVSTGAGVASGAATTCSTGFGASSTGTEEGTSAGWSMGAWTIGVSGCVHRKHETNINYKIK